MNSPRRDLARPEVTVQAKTAGQAGEAAAPGLGEAPVSLGRPEIHLSASRAGEAAATAEIGRQARPEVDVQTRRHEG